MNRTLLCLVSAALVCGAVMQAADSSATTQVERGRQFFASSSKGMACTTCHSMEGVGNSVGPDLKKLASVIGPRGLATTIQMTMTCYVQEVKLSNGHTFPGMEKQKEKGVVQMWDLSKVPATLLTLKESEIDSEKTNTEWKHPPSVSKFTAQELADIIGFLKFASTGVAKEVTEAELQ